MQAEIHNSIATAKHLFRFWTDHCRAVLNVVLSSMYTGRHYPEYTPVTKTKSSAAPQRGRCNKTAITWFTEEEKQ
jgi:hypothetical protein